MQLTKQQAHKLKQLYGSPLFIFDQQALVERYQNYICAMRSHYDNCILAYSYKTNPLAALITTLHRQGALAEVVSHDEYQLAQKLAPSGSKVIFNGPIKKDQDLIQAMHSNTLIHCDHFEELQRLAAMAKSHNKMTVLGIRLSIDEKGHWNRFGFKICRRSYAEAQAAVDFIKQSSHLNLTSLHCHIGTNISDMSQFHLMSSLLNDFAWTLDKQGVSLSAIDIGGGLAGASPRWDQSSVLAELACLESYADNVLPPLLPYLKAKQCQLYFEPGRSLVEHTVKLLFSVHALRNSDSSDRQYIVDSGIHTVPTSRVYRHPVTCFHGADEMINSTLLGPTCMQHDMSQAHYGLPRLKRDDLLLMHHVGAYNMSRCVPFIHLRPGCVMYCDEDKTFQLIKPPESLDTYLAQELGY